ncbi:hypothetical protein [Allorhizocola rhizosphaerae]|uniref:hypothetical protein n=1 Tax=Allorhizocola rhizosphaerae TaxID=1872709 RepID=UPI000E3D2E59|nr:hypothetical protein [Allorhizocola rhizosphaerae]
MDYRDIESWEQSLRGTFIAPLGFSATNALNFVAGHVIYSFCAPIAVAEAWRPQAARTPWLGPAGIAVAAAAYVLAAVLIVSDPESHSGSAAQVAGSLVVGGLCAGAAVILRRRRRDQDRPRTRHAPALWATVAASFVVFLAAEMVPPETWVGVGITTAVFIAGTVLLAHVSRSCDWGVRHTAAVAIGALLSRGTLAFTYYPLIGQTSAVQKYGHNVVTLAIVGLAGWLALRNPTATRMRR